MKSLKDILNGTPEEYSDENLESSIVEAVDATPPKVEKPAEADKVAAAMANLSDMVTMADEIYYTLSDLEEIEEEMVGKIEMIFASLDELYKEVDETYDIAVPEMGPTEVEEAEELIGRSLDDILNEDSAAKIQSDETPDKGDSGTLIPLKAGKFNKRSLIRTMRKPEGVIQTSDGNQFTIYHPIDQSDIWQDKSVFATDEDGGEVEVNYDDITSYSETYDEDDAAVIRSMTYDGMEMPKTKIGILTAMKRELRAMKVADIKASYQYIKAAHCNTKEGMQGMGTKKNMLAAMYKDLQGMKKHELMASYEYIKSAHCGPHEGAHEDEMLNASSCTSEENEISEAIDFSKASSEGLISWVQWAKTVAGPTTRKSPDFKKDLASAEKEAKKRGLKVEGVDLEENEISEAIDFSKVPDKSLIAWIGKFRTVLTKAGLPLEVDRYVKGNPWSDFKKDFASAEKEAKKRGLKVEGVDLEEMKTKDDDLAVQIYDYIGADTEGLPLKTLIHQAVGKYFGSQRDKKKVNEATSRTVKTQKPFDANSELMRVVNSLDQVALNSLWDYKIIDKKRPLDVEGAIFPLYREATLKIFNVRGEEPFSDEQKKYLLDMYKKAQKGAGFGVGRKWAKMEFSRDGMEATAKIIVRSKEIFDKNEY